ncbi:143b7d88-b383-4f81-9582-5c0a231d0648 [Thermothielavioides terrestris]|uniref:143b7d88-b383-4f81-9582-5c0a231d0648 n=1 Tax=Thermothielavioides terrestris TaxID=2587410 RepID=A0A446B9U4_9PEZI|nr:143b7d88-b383-4f81-9582-5c0a231d0648 [Thermothielavioides terrestris]
MDAHFHDDGAASRFSALGQDVAAVQALGDPTDLDFDFDNFWSAGVMDLEPDLSLNYGSQATSFPADLLFAEDEGVLPSLSGYDGQPPSTSTASTMPVVQRAQPSPTPTDFSMSRCDAGSEDSKHLDDGAHGHGMAHQRLRRQLSLLSKGWAGDEIRFKNCDPAKAVVLHSLAMELGLGYSHDVRSREVAMSRLNHAPPQSQPPLASGSLASSLSRSSTELDSTLCLPDLPVVPEFLPIPESAVPDTYGPSLLPSQPTPPKTVPTDQPLARRPSRSERIISTLKTSISKGGRRGPLSENGRRDMRALEGAGGACWRCKVLRRKRLADMKAVFEGASHKLSITDHSLHNSFCAFIETGRYRDRDSLQRSYSSGGKAFTYTELIAVIAWELAENQGLLSLLEIKSWESFMRMLEAACVYESEVGQTSLVILSMVCLKHCLEALRLHAANLLSPEAHEDCRRGQCRVECIRNLSSKVAAYVDELSSVIFNKENMRDRRWWLSTFYSFHIQGPVRHALIAIERQLRFQSADDVPAEELSATQYLHLPAVLFTAASAKYDPLLDGRLHYALTDSSVIPEASVPELHHSSARVAFEVDKWHEAGIRSPYQFLRRLLQIGSLDFPDSGPFAPGMSGSRSPMAIDTPSAAHAKIEPPISPRLVGGRDSLAFQRPFPGHGKRDSIGSCYSAQPSSMFSNQSSDSLPRTFTTDMTSLYESSLVARMSFSGSVTNLNADLGVDLGTVDPTALFSGQHNGSSQSLDQILRESALKKEPPAVGQDPTFVCSCCPRAPRQFHTREELALHEAEKPHPCSQCKKRFKSPTEAERHINAIHVKSDFWSCKGLENPLLAFHADVCEGVVWDLCGFCGGGFARTADGQRDEASLVDHVESVHHVGQCDRNKNFYRADNFRQHLRNSHAAATGKWLKTLERACWSTTDAV